MILANKYKILEQIGQGTFGKVFKGENIRTKELVAIKIEKHEANTPCSLKYETQIYQAIGHGSGSGIPAIKWFGIADGYYFMVLPLLGISLSEFKRVKVQAPFSLTTTLYFGTQMIKRLQFIHEKGFIHRDVKPDNFLLDVSSLFITLVDVGFCRKYINDSDGKHIPIHNDRNLIGSPNYVSDNMHRRIEPSRRDDLESVGYIMIYLLTNKVKRETTEKKICDYLIYCKNLAFEQTPNYNYLYSILTAST